MFKKIFSLKNKNIYKYEFYKILLYNLIKFSKFSNNLIFNNFLSFYDPNFFLKIKFKKKLKFINLFNFNNNFTILNNRLFNNYFPVYNSSKIIKKKFKNIFKSIRYKFFVKSIHYYVISMFEILLNRKFFLRAVNNNFFKLKRFKSYFRYKQLYKIFLKNKKLSYYRKINFNLMELIEVLFYSFYHKDLIMFKFWFLKNFRKIHYTRQKNFLVFLKIIITDIFEHYKHIFNIQGFYIVVKGKVLVTSNAKKKTVRFRVGPLNKTSKNQKIDFQQGVVKAPSGSSGLLIILTYN